MADGYDDAFLESLGFTRGTWGYWIDLPGQNGTVLRCECGGVGNESPPAQSEWWIVCEEGMIPEVVIIADSIPTKERVLSLLAGLGITSARSC